MKWVKYHHRAEVSLVRRHTEHAMSMKLHRQQVKCVRVMMNHINSQSVTTIFLRWKLYATRRTSEKSRACQRMAYHMDRVHLSSAFLKWSRMCARAGMGELQQRYHQSVNATKDKLAAYDQTVATLRTRNESERQRWSTILQTIHSRYHRRQIFCDWRRHAHTYHRRKAVVLNKIMSRLYQRSLQPSFVHWRYAVRTLRLTASYERHLQLQAHGSHNRLLHEKMVRYRVMVQKWKAMRQCTVQYSFIAWKNYSHRQRHQKRLALAKIIHRLEHHHRTGVYWRRWLDYTASQRLDDLRHQHVVHVYSINTQHVEIFLRRRDIHSMKLMFHQWRAAARQQRARKKTILVKLTDRLTNVTLARAWKQWIMYLHSSTIADMHHQHHTETAQLTTQLIHQQSERLKSFHRHWERHIVSTRFRDWKEWLTARRQRRLALLDKYCTKLFRMELVHSFHRWTMYASSHRMMELRDDLLHRHSADVTELTSIINHHKQKRLHQMIVKWREATIIPAMQEWRRVTQENKQRKKEIIGKFAPKSFMDW